MPSMPGLRRHDHYASAAEYRGAVHTYNALSESLKRLSDCAVQVYVWPRHVCQSGIPRLPVPRVRFRSSLSGTYTTSPYSKVALGGLGTDGCSTCGVIVAGQGYVVVCLEMYVRPPWSSAKCFSSIHNPSTPMRMPPHYGRRDRHISANEAFGAAVMVIVLVVDDDPVSRARLQQVLDAAGNTTIDVNDGNNAIAVLLQSSTPLVVLLELVLPDFSGVHIISTVGTFKVPRHAFILMTEAAEMPSPSVMALLAELSIPMLVRPFSDKVLVDTVAAAVLSLDET
jgi:CheY-like chemotaxis protein